LRNTESLRLDKRRRLGDIVGAAIGWAHLRPWFRVLIQPPRHLRKRYLPRVAAALIFTGLASAARAQSVDWLLNIDDAVDPVSAVAAIE
jgi:hypothetical protein